MMASKGQNFIERLRARPVDRDPPGGREPANQSDPREAGGQRGPAYPGRSSLPRESSLEVDLLDDDGGRQRSGWRSGVSIVAALSVAAGVLWYGYNWGIEQLSTTRLPVIVADTAPLKSRPESSGGIEVLNQDVAVLNDAAPGPGEPQVERLLPPPEAPQIAQMTAPQIAQTEAPQGISVAEVESLLGPPLETAAGPIENLAATEQAELPAAPQVAAADPPEAATLPALPEPQVEALPVPEPPAAPPAPPSVTASVETREPAPQVAALPVAQTGDYVVQLAALKAEGSTRPAWSRMQKAHPSLLGDRELAIQRVDLGNRGIFYRVQAGFFAERAGANELCAALKARGQDCLVVKR